MFLYLSKKDTPGGCRAYLVVYLFPLLLLLLSLSCLDWSLPLFWLRPWSLLRLPVCCWLPLSAFLLPLFWSPVPPWSLCCWPRFLLFSAIILKFSVTFIDIKTVPHFSTKSTARAVRTKRCKLSRIILKGKTDVLQQYGYLGPKPYPFLQQPETTSTAAQWRAVAAPAAKWRGNAAGHLFFSKIL